MLGVLNNYATSMSKELAKQYEPGKVEDAIYQKWEDSGYFNPDICIKKKVTAADAEPFSIVLPPPNVTGTLHLGHAAMLAIEDTIVRFHRMQGDRTLWIPGTDHAAIATQSKVEKMIQEKEGKDRYDLGREKFLARVEEYAQDSHDTIVNQSKKMGASLDWSREAYTLDEKRHTAVYTAFKKMYDDGLIYQGARIVNWDPLGQTTVSDDEVIYKEETTKFYYLKYGPFVIGTSRPETKFGDKYVVMHPEDQRYKDFTHGQKIDLEWINGPITATVIKDEAIDMDFGSGVMTITPWHDMTDFDIAQRHDLDYEQIIDFDGKLLDIAGDYTGQSISQARKSIIKKLDEKGLIDKIEDHYIHNIATAERSGGIIEPQIKKQWWVNVNKEFDQKGKKTTLKKLMQTAVRDDLIDILPERFSKTYFHWIDNLRDWCISRQIWYGHQIPVWYRGDEIYCDVKPPEGDGWQQDPDTLDTWFSSGLWTFSTLDWPNTTSDDFKTYHPTTLLETGYDILFFWVARMILMTRYLLDGDVPFKTAYLHGLIRDDKGRKMSKSLGNIIDPLDVSKKYGTDAVRLALIIGTTPGNDTRLSDEKIECFRNFTNKLWNIGRYVLNVMQDKRTEKFEATSAADHNIISQLHQLTTRVTKNLETYQLSNAGEALRDFTWNEFADWYVETHKVEKNDALLFHVYTTLLRLWHPFMPFVTEQLWQEIYDGKQILMVEKYPVESTVTAEEKDVQNFEDIKDLITKVRNIRAIYKVDQGTAIPLTVVTKKEALITVHDDLIKRLAHVNTITILQSDQKQQHAASATLTDMKLYVHLEGIIDIAKEQKRLSDESDQTHNYINSIEKRLSNEQFVSKAPAQVVKTEKENLATAQKKLTQLKKHLDQIS